MDSKEMISEAKLELENIDMVIDVKHNPVISAFISLMKEMPFIGDLIDDSLESVLSDFQSKKQQKLLEVIGQASLGTVTSDMVNDVEFIMGFAKTKNAVDKLSNGDKVKFYGNLLVNGYLNDKDKISVDEFDEYLELINSLSYRELEYLSFFKEYSNKYKGRLVYQNWAEFSREFRNKFPNKHVHSVFKRLQRTGLINEVMETEAVEEDTPSLDIGYAGFEVDPELSRFNEMVLKNI
ncbi:hypothetical protein [Anaerostipes hadrus]|uniref:hypothetical protein n=1 Tax=Anaerostipes hadrus TaxID=649756 RepID=UPI001ADD8A3A|nr:hypothetical protein [Anaerostipes hadrus]MBP0074458.1 hypothetical protein [Anaerostipes hadrus]